MEENINTSLKKPLPIRISVSEAARLFGVSSKTIRIALKNQELHYIIVNNRYKINFDSLLRWSQKSTRRRNLLSTNGLGQYVEKWLIHNKKYSPNIELVKKLYQNNNPLNTQENNQQNS